MLVAKIWPACEKLIGQPISSRDRRGDVGRALLQRGEQALEHVGALFRRGARPGPRVECAARDATARSTSASTRFRARGRSTLLGERRDDVDDGGCSEASRACRRCRTCRERSRLPPLAMKRSRWGRASYPRAAGATRAVRRMGGISPCARSGSGRRCRRFRSSRPDSSRGTAGGSPRRSRTRDWRPGSRW